VWATMAALCASMAANTGSGSAESALVTAPPAKVATAMAGALVAIRQEPIELPGAAKLAEPPRQGQVWLRVAAGTKDPHTERGAESTDIAPDSDGAHDACGLAFQ
jgi:hypothetical protein